MSAGFKGPQIEAAGEAVQAQPASGEGLDTDSSDTAGASGDVLTRARLEDIYREWNRPEFVSPDPLETLSAYPKTADREVAALLASSMAYGRVSALLVPLKKILTVMGESPLDYVSRRTEEQMAGDFAGIVHRFAREQHLAALLAGAGRVIREQGSLEQAFLSGYGGSRRTGSPVPVNLKVRDDRAAGRKYPDDDRVLAGLKSMEFAVRQGAAGEPGHLLIDPAKGSACKRLFLFLRWMVRQDAVDPGGWDNVDPADLMLPLDTWTYRIARRAGWTGRKASDLRTVREVSRKLKAINPDDPIKYDFALSRFGIRAGLDLDQLFGKN